MCCGWFIYRFPYNAYMMLDILHRKHTIPKLLTYCGALPFYMGGIGVMVYMNPSIMMMHVLYAAMIAVFLCGTHWACYLLRDDVQDEIPLNLFIISNVLTLMIMAAAFLGQSVYYLFVLFMPLILFVLYRIDMMLFRAGVIEEWYLALRRRVTIIVILSYFPLWIFIGLSMLNI